MDFDDYGENDEIVPEETDFLNFGEEGGEARNQEAAVVPSNANATADALVITDDLEYPSVTVKNMICSIEMKTEVDLRLVTVKCRNVEWNPRRINAAIIRLQKPKLTCMLFSSGKMTICGATSLEDAKLAAKLATRLVQKTGHPEAVCGSFKMETLICAAACGFPVRLENLAKDHNRYCNYEPETFCGLVYRYQVSADVKASILVFVSGKLIITGCRTLETAETVFRDLYAVLYQYRV
eukprot:Blabericola_migrator_1__1464@NODE_1387_length_4641_cov_160_569961_g928_i0_p3_GENE_NODE_1387_length_4641_cov_160_569961_g928_i0NODE_1387_length_4641_cov_160_569961_g928_i0_p3_ORF_typecomplete_len238_score45_62TBP/PF00352_21/1_2e22TBP/PF00352_21/4_1e19DUF3378/PF11858_8/1_5DUF3378/PF11858_8/1_2e02DUF5102/PF17104_5/0_072_NODE_1387_length_4641_cov_160_569961_g928_i0239952